VKINLKKGWNRILIILSVVWGGVCFIFVLEHERGLVSILFFSALIWVVGLVVFLICIKLIEWVIELIGWVIAGFRDKDDETEDDEQDI